MKTKTILGLITTMLFASQANAFDIELGRVYSRSATGNTTKNLVSLANSYKFGNLNIGLKLEKANKSQPGFKTTLAYPISNTFFVYGAEKLSLDSKLDPSTYTTELGVGKMFGKASVWASGYNYNSADGKSKDCGMAVQPGYKFKQLKFNVLYTRSLNSKGYTLKPTISMGLK